jgi:hypothetical protein
MRKFPFDIENKWRLSSVWDSVCNLLSDQATVRIAIAALRAPIGAANA